MRTAAFSKRCAWAIRRPPVAAVGQMHAHVIRVDIQSPGQGLGHVAAQRPPIALKRRIMKNLPMQRAVIAGAGRQSSKRRGRRCYGEARRTRTWREDDEGCSYKLAGDYGRDGQQSDLRQHAGAEDPTHDASVRFRRERRTCNPRAAP